MFSLMGCPIWTTGYCVRPDGSVLIMPDVFDEFGEPGDIETLKMVRASLTAMGVRIVEKTEEEMIDANLARSGTRGPSA
jgi:hypothetical protein